MSTKLHESPGSNADERLLIAEADRRELSRVRRLEAHGTLRTVLGQPSDWNTNPASLGAPAATGRIDVPGAIDVLPDGRLLVAERYSSRVVAVLPGRSPGPVAHPYAGTGNPAVAGRAGDRGPACSADLADPTSIAGAPDGSTYVAYYQNS